MGQHWSLRRITTTCIHPENTFSARTFDVSTDEDLKDELATALGITRDLLATYHNPHNGLRFFYVAPDVAAAADAKRGMKHHEDVGDNDAQGYLTDLATVDRGRNDNPMDVCQNYLAQGLLRKGDTNRNAPAVYGFCYVCKQCTDRDPFASCFPEDFDIITGRSRVANATHVLALAEMANEEEEKLKVKRAKLEVQPPPPLAAAEVVELPKEEEAVIVTEEKEPACPAGAGHAEEDTLPPNLAALRDQVYCQILLNGIKGTATTTVTSLPPPIEVFVAAALEEVSAHQPPAALETFRCPGGAPNTSIVVEEDEAAETVPEQKKDKKPRQRRHHAVCADDIVPAGVRRSARLRT